MIRNAENAWLAIFIFCATDIPGINMSPSEILNSRKYRTNLPMIDLHQKSNKSEIEKMSERQINLPRAGKELPKLPVGTRVLYEQNPDSKLKHPKWSKGMVNDRSNPRKYKILMNGDRIITRCWCHIKGYYNWSGRISKAPSRLIES